jgi:hypothetical protein
LRAGFFEAIQYKLDNLNFFSLHAFLTAGSDERDLLAFFQAFEAVGLDGFEVHEQVVTVPVWRLDMVYLLGQS